MQQHSSYNPTIKEEKAERHGTFPIHAVLPAIHYLRMFHI